VSSFLTQPNNNSNIQPMSFIEQAINGAMIQATKANSSSAPSSQAHTTHLLPPQQRIQHRVL
jgi:hypothetical protein